VNMTENEANGPISFFINHLQPYLASILAKVRTTPAGQGLAEADAETKPNEANALSLFIAAR